MSQSEVAQRLLENHSIFINSHPIPIFSQNHQCHKSVSREDCHEPFFSPHRTDYHHIFEESCLPKNSPFVNEIWAAIDIQLLDIRRSPASILIVTETTTLKIIGILKWLFNSTGRSPEYYLIPDP